MSGTGEGHEEEAWSGEEDELIPRCSRNLHQTDEGDGGDGQIPRGKQWQQQQKPGVSADERKGKNCKESDKNGGSKGNRRKIQAKVEQMLLSPVGRFRKQLTGTKNMGTETRIRRSAAPFPYDGKDFGGSPSSRYLCFRPPSIPPTSDSPRKVLGTAGSAGAADTVKPKQSRHYYFLKDLIENNEFYSPECNPHREVTGSPAK